MLASESSKEVEAHFYGEAKLDGEIKFVVQRKLNEIKIILQLEGNCYNGSLKLDVIVPKALEKISVKTESASVSLNEGVSAQSIKVETISGAVRSYAAFAKKVNISTISGSIKLNITANTDISVKTSTISGSVSAKFTNVKNIKLTASTVSGKIRNHHETDNYGYNANVDISTISGSVTID